MGWGARVCPRGGAGQGGVGSSKQSTPCLERRRDTGWGGQGVVHPNKPWKKELVAARWVGANCGGGRGRGGRDAQSGAGPRAASHVCVRVRVHLNLVCCHGGCAAKAAAGPAAL